MNVRPKAVVLLSGGLDSTTTLAIAKSQGYEIYALSFRVAREAVTGAAQGSNGWI